MTAEAFFKELKRLALAQPKLSTHSLNSENCEYGDQLYYCKNMINSFDDLNSNDGVYVFDSQICANCIDCDYAYESQLCYDSVTINKCFNSNYLDDCTSVRDSSYSYNCREGSYLFGCANLTGKSYCIFNRQLTEQEYNEKIQKFKSLPQEQIFQMLDALKKKFPITQTRGDNNENSPFGNYINNCKNSYMCFDSINLDNCGYNYDSGVIKDCFDVTFSGDSEISYQIIDSTHLFNCNFAIWSGHCSDSSYILACGNVKNCLGCVDLYQREYCILNRQFTKEEYEIKSKQILEELKQKNMGWADLVF